MEHLIIWLIHAIIKALTQKSKSESPSPISIQPQTPARPLSNNGPTIDVWADYRRKQAAIEREMSAKSPTAPKR